MGRPNEALVISERDNVATALESLERGALVRVRRKQGVLEIVLKSDVPLGHKFALTDLPGGTSVIKYGESIGWTTRAVMQGEHVHVHNVSDTSRNGGGALWNF
jgi:altronate dehydratase small subunit